MYRALAPLESIIQAAGRCNRNGTLPEPGIVTVFVPEDTCNIYPGDFYRTAAETVKLMLSQGNLDIHDPSAITAYYRKLFRNVQVRSILAKAMNAEDYAGVEQAYRLIQQQGVQVLVPYPPKLSCSRRSAARRGQRAGPPRCCGRPHRSWFPAIRRNRSVSIANRSLGTTAVAARRRKATFIFCVPVTKAATGRTPACNG